MLRASSNAFEAASNHRPVRIRRPAARRQTQLRPVVKASPRRYDSRAASALGTPQRGQHLPLSSKSVSSGKCNREKRMVGLARRCGVDRWAVAPSAESGQHQIGSGRRACILPLAGARRPPRSHQCLVHNEPTTSNPPSPIPPQLRLRAAYGLTVRPMRRTHRALLVAGTRTSVPFRAIDSAALGRLHLHEGPVCQVGQRVESCPLIDFTRSGNPLRHVQPRLPTNTDMRRSTACSMSLQLHSRGQ
jgi:hypothetical protein